MCTCRILGFTAIIFVLVGGVVGLTYLAMVNLSPIDDFKSGRLAAIVLCVAISTTFGLLCFIYKSFYPIHFPVSVYAGLPQRRRSPPDRAMKIMPNDGPVFSFVRNIFKETFIYQDNTGPDARGLRHGYIAPEAVSYVTVSKAKTRYLNKRITVRNLYFPEALMKSNYPNKPQGPILLAMFYTGELCRFLKLDTTREVLLLHGTKYEYLNNIMDKGLLPSSNGLYGPGIYLTDSCQKADRYADRRDVDRKSDELIMLIVKAALGNLVPHRHKEHNTDYDSLIGGLGFDTGTRFREFVLKSVEHCCIEFVVCYKREGVMPP